MRGMSGLLNLLEKYRGESAIIYCGSRKDTEEMAAALKEQGFTAEPHHAGLEPGVRRATQERFIRDRTPIVVATIAFGMGINKPDVRLVVHYDLPKSIESYYQRNRSRRSATDKPASASCSTPTPGSPGRSSS